MFRWNVIVLALGLSAAGCSSDEGPPQMPPPPEVTVANPLVRNIVEWDRFTGRLEAIDSVDVRSRVSGYLDQVLFEEGQIVEEGDLLAVIDPRPFEAEVARARAALEEARARLAQSQAQLAQANAESTQARSAESLAQSRLANAKQALASNSIAKEQADIRESEYAQAVAAVESAKAAIAAANASIATAEAGIETAQAALEGAELDLGYTKISAPVHGRIGSRLVTRGNLVQGGGLGADLLTTIVSIDPMHVSFEGSEQDFLKYLRLDRSGKRESSRNSRNPVYVALIDEEGYPHSGHIDFVDNQIDPDTGTIRARAILPNPDGVLTPGLFATVRLPGSARYEAIMIPDEVIQANQTQRFVLTVGEGEQVAITPVVPGPLVDGLRVVRSGLDGTERLIIGGLQRVRPGMPVSAKSGAIEASEDADGLPNDYRPVSEEEWIRVDREPRSNGGE